MKIMLINRYPKFVLHWARKIYTFRSQQIFYSCTRRASRVQTIVLCVNSQYAGAAVSHFIEQNHLPTSVIGSVTVTHSVENPDWVHKAHSKKLTSHSEARHPSHKYSPASGHIIHNSKETALNLYKTMN